MAVTSIACSAMMLMMKMTIVVTLLAVGQVASFTSGRCTGRGFRPIPGSCSQFHMCSMGILIKFTCAQGSVFHQASGSCVPQGSAFDLCTTQDRSLPVERQPLPVTPTCPPGATYKKAHPASCARYYDCARPAMDMHWEEHEWECEYPNLFNPVSSRCEPFSTVSCGSRKEEVDPCDYKANNCVGSSHCRPCHIRFPSCRGLPDGMNGWKGKENSPYFVVCEKGRVVYQGSCPQQDRPTVFDAQRGVCTTRVVENRNYWWL